MMTMRARRGRLGAKESVQRLKTIGEDASRALMKAQGRRLSPMPIKDERTRRLALEKEVKMIVEAQSRCGWSGARSTGCPR